MVYAEYCHLDNLDFYNFIWCLFFIKLDKGFLIIIINVGDVINN